MKVLIPFRLKNPKVRLSVFMSEEERRKLALSMLSDVLGALKDSGIDMDVEVILRDEDGADAVKDVVENFNPSWSVEVDSRDLDDVVNDRLGERTAVVVSDLPMLSGKVVRDFFSSKADLVLAPGRRGGTNMMLVNRASGKFRASYHYGSFFKHLSLARTAGMSVEVFDSFFAGSDVDTADDLLEVLLHAPESNTGRCLREMGFRVALERNPRLYRLYRPFGVEFNCSDSGWCRK